MYIDGCIYIINTVCFNGDNIFLLICQCTRRFCAPIKIKSDIERREKVFQTVNEEESVLYILEYCVLVILFYFFYT